MSERWLGWHFLQPNGRTGQGNRKPIPGHCMHATGALALCANGMHASKRAIDALGYAPGPVVQRVELVGERLDDADTSCARMRRCLWIADATTLLHEFACDVVEQALSQERVAGREPDERSWTAIEVKRRWLRGAATNAALDAAYAAAWAVPHAASAAAWHAARAAASAAEWGAARGAYAAARDAASAACRADAWDEMSHDLHNRLMRLAPEGYDEGGEP